MFFPVAATARVNKNELLILEMVVRRRAQQHWPCNHILRFPDCCAREDSDSIMAFRATEHEVHTLRCFVISTMHPNALRDYVVRSRRRRHDSGCLTTTPCCDASAGAILGHSSCLRAAKKAITFCFGSWLLFGRSATAGLSSRTVLYTGSAGGVP